MTALPTAAPLTAPLTASIATWCAMPLIADEFCLKPGQVHPGPCKGPSKIKRAVRKIAARKAISAPAPKPAPAHQRAQGRDLLAELDMNRIGPLPKRDTLDADQQLAVIAHAQGFDGLPAVGTARDLDALKDEYGIEVWRGVKHGRTASAEEIAEQFRSGPIHYGQGISGNGIYTGSNEDVALRYTTNHDGDGVTRMVIHPDAQVIELGELRDMMDAEIPDDTRARIKALGAFHQNEVFIPGGRPQDTIARAMRAPREMLQPQDWIWMDPSAYAMAKGFDVVKQQYGRHDEYVILNRTAVMAQQADHLPRTLRDFYPEDYLTAGLDPQVALCLPPHVPVPKPGPCPGARRGVKKAVAKIGKTGRTRLDVGTRLSYRDLVRRMESGKAGDQAMAEIARRQGFDAEPLKGTQSDLDKVLDAGGVEMWRTQSPYADISADEMTDRFFNGPADYGFGLWGSGWAANTDARAFDNSPLPLLRMVIPRDADVVDLDDLVRRQKIQQRTTVAQQRKLFAALDAANGATVREKALRALQDWTARQPDRDRVLRDPGRFAAALGHDAIRIRRPGQPDRYVILNRGNVWVEQKTSSRTAAAALDECRDELLRDKARRKKKRAKPVSVAYGKPAGVTALLVRETVINACRPPHVPVPKPGPCPGVKRGLKKAVRTIAKPKEPKPPKQSRERVLEPTRTPIAEAPATGGPGTGRDLSHLLDSEVIGALPIYDANFNDPRLLAIAREQGFDAPARLADSDELDEESMHGGRELWRGIVGNDKLSGRQMHELNSTGPLRFAQGRYGNGIYFTDRRDPAARYSDGTPGALQRAVLPSSARVIGYKDLLQLMEADRSAQARQHQEKSARLLRDLARTRRGGDMMISWNAYRGSPGQLSPTDSLKTDPATWAMAHGYDAYIVPQEDAEYIVVLNRSALMVDREQQESTNASTISAAAATATGRTGATPPRVQACMPPAVPVPKPGPCKGIKRTAKAGVKKLAGDTVVPRRARRAGPGGGKNLARLLNMESIAQLPHRSTVGNDERLAAIAREQGFDAPARVVDTATLDKAIRDGGREMWRGLKTSKDLGLSPQDVHDQSATGPVHYGRGIFGNGIYFSDAESVAATYGDNLFFPQDSVRRSVLDPRARTITYAELAKKMARDKSTSSSKHQQRAKRLLESLAKARDTADMRMALETWQGSPYSMTPEDKLRTDPGAWAMSRGYDAIIVPLHNANPNDRDDRDQHEIVVLNRGALLTETRPPETS